jgi:hypothetical protein
MHRTQSEFDDNLTFKVFLFQVEILKRTFIFFAQNPDKSLERLSLASLSS